MSEETCFGKIKILQVREPWELKEFIDLPKKVYQKDPLWAPQLEKDLREFLNPQKNPFFSHAHVQYFLAEKSGEVKGRIAAIQNLDHNNFYHDKVGFFGFFECCQDENVSQALFEVAASWLKKRKLVVIRGPINFSMNEDFGCLISKDQSYPYPAVPLQPYSPPFYDPLLMNSGFSPLKDFLAFSWERKGIPFRKNVHKAFLDLNKVKIRPIRTKNTKDFLKDLNAIRLVYQKAWSKNWGFIPMRDEELIFLAKRMQPILDPNLLLLAEAEGEIVGIHLGIPDYFPLLRVFKGKAYPWRWPKAFWEKWKKSTAVLFAFGIKPSWRHTGLADLLLHEFLYRNRRYQNFETNWILEDNKVVQHLIQTRFNAKPIKRFRIYEKKI